MTDRYTPLLAALLLSILAGCSQPPTASDTVIYPAAAVITMDQHPDSPVRAEAVAVRNGEIIGVDSLDTLRTQLPSAAIDQQFAGRYIMPGFVEPHLHPYLVGLLLQMEFITPHDWTLLDGLHPGVKTAAEYRARLSEYEAGLGTDEWLWSWGFHPLFHGPIDRAYLDSLSATRPIIVWHRSFHEVYLNSAAIAALQIDSALADHPAIDFDAGHFYETGLFAISHNLMVPLMRPASYLPALAKGLKLMQQRGITSVGDGAFGSINLQVERQLLAASAWNQTDAPVHSYLLLDGRALLDAHGYEGIEAVIAEAQSFNSDKITVQPRQIKLFVDGAAYSQLMQMSEGYTDGHHGEWLMEPAALERAMRFFWQRGYQLHLHVNGDLGMQLTLDILRKLQTEAPRSDHRTTIHHLAYVRPEQMRELAELGGMVQANPYYVWALADSYAEHGLGPERAAAMVPAASVVEAGMPLAFHSDFTMAPADPLLLAWAAASRVTAGGAVVAPEQRISINEALQAITIDAAYQLRREDQIGSIAVGKRANFTVLASDPYRAAVDGGSNQLKDISVIATLLDGVVTPVK